MDHYMLHVQESVNLTIYLYAQTMGQQRMLYIRKFYVVKNIYIYIYIYIIYIYISIYIKISCLSVTACLNNQISLKRQQY